MPVFEKNIIKNWFLSGLKPLQQHYHSWMDSYVHKDDEIGIDKITGLLATLSNSANLFSPINMELSSGVDNEITVGVGKVIEIIVLECGSQPATLQIKSFNQVIYEFVQDQDTALYRLDYYTGSSSEITINCSQDSTIKIYRR